MNSSKKTETEPPVPFGTAEADKLAKRYLSFAKKSAENVIKMAETLVDAEKLFEFARRDFCTAVKLEHSGSKYRKLLKIGQEASRFEPFLDRLPNSWTTLYRLAVLDKDQFDRVVKDELFAPTMTAAEVNLVLGGESDDDQSEQLPIDCRIHLKGLEPSKKIEVCDKIMSLAEEYGEYGFKYGFSASLEKELAPAPAKPSLVEFLVRRKKTVA